jgi:hypothetical protein
MEAAKRPDGTPKLPGPRSWRNIQKTFIFRSKKTQQAYIAYKRPGGGLTVLYVLVDEFTLTKHTGKLIRAWDLEKPSLVEALGRAMLFEMGTVDLLGLARVTYRGYKPPKG